MAKKKKAGSSQVDKLQEEVDELLDKKEELEEHCDTLDLCAEDDGCSKCKYYAQMAEIEDKVEALEDQIEELLGAEEAEVEEE